MSEDLSPLDAWANGLLENLTPSARRALAQKIANDLKSSQQKRIAAQTSPDGTAFVPRKPQLRDKTGRIRRQMFTGLRKSQNLKAEATSGSALVGFTSRVERIACVHQFGLRDRVRPGGPEYQYPERPLLGISETDASSIEDLIIERLSR